MEIADFFKDSTAVLILIGVVLVGLVYSQIKRLGFFSKSQVKKEPVKASKELLADFVKQVEQLQAKNAAAVVPEFAVILGMKSNPLDTFIIPFADSRSVQATLTGLESGMLAESADPLSKALFMMKKNGYNIRVLDTHSRLIGDPKFMGGIFKSQDPPFSFSF